MPYPKKKGKKMKTSIKVGFFLFVVGALGTMIVVHYKGALNPGLYEDLGVIGAGLGCFGLFLIVCAFLGRNEEKRLG